MLAIKLYPLTPYLQKNQGNNNFISGVRSCKPSSQCPLTIPARQVVFLLQVGKCVGENHQIPFKRLANSLQWIFDTTNCECYIKTSGVNVLSLSKKTHKADTMNPVGIYLCTYILQNAAWIGHMIQWDSNRQF